VKALDDFRVVQRSAKGRFDGISGNVSIARFGPSVGIPRRLLGCMESLPLSFPVVEKAVYGNAL
jgi:hypothetical protein